MSNKNSAVAATATPNRLDADFGFGARARGSLNERGEQLKNFDSESKRPDQEGALGSFALPVGSVDVHLEIAYFPFEDGVGPRT